MNSNKELLLNLLKQSESEWLDFKEVFSTDNKDFRHDALCLYNTPILKEKYLVYGVDDNKKIVGIDEYLESNNLNNLLATSNFSQIFSVQVENINIDGKFVSIVVIPINTVGPVVSKSNKHGLTQNCVYIRNGDANTGKTETCPPEVVRKIYEVSESYNKKTTTQICTSTKASDIPLLREHSNIHDIFHIAIKDYNNWGQNNEYINIYEQEITTFYYKSNMDFTIKVVPHLNDFQEPWAQDAPDKKASSYHMELKYKSIKIDEVISVWTDGGRNVRILPFEKIFSDSDDKQHTYYYYYLNNTLNYDLNIFIQNHYSLYMNRAPWINFPIFDNHENAIQEIESDFYSEERKLISYSTVDKSSNQSNTIFGGYKRYPIS